MRKATVCILTFLTPWSAISWQQWSYSTHTTDDWRDIWGFAEGPRGRRGHSMIVYNETKIVMFGGRDNEIHRHHVPRTYELKETQGSLEFSTYDDKPVLAHYDPDGGNCEPIKKCVSLVNASSGNNETCSYHWEGYGEHGESSREKSEERREEECGFVPVGLYYNDVWVYDVECERYADFACTDSGWNVGHPGKTFGGCRDKGRLRVCDIPSERWGHGAVMFDERNSTMLVYGGFSHECEDYCDDLWSLDLRNMEWTELSPIGSKNGPGKRWKFSMVSEVVHPVSKDPAMILFGGHRLWHGFASDNSEENGWESTDIYPKGGYMNDLWIYTNQKPAKDSTGKDGESSEPIHGGGWEELKGRESCVAAPGVSWESRNDIECRVRDWPKARAGHAAIYDKDRQLMFVHGGFTAYHPYISGTGPGSSWGTKTQGTVGFTPYPTYPFYLDDLWMYNVLTGFWEQMKPSSQQNPSKRTEHIMVLSANTIILFGGYADNYHYNDTWHYYIDKNRWLEKKSFVHAHYPDTCSDDFERIKKDQNCILLDFPLGLKRSNESTLYLKYQEILPFKDQIGYTPDSNNLLYFGIVDNAANFVADLRKKFIDNKVYDGDGNRIWVRSDIPDGTPIAPNAATSLRQYARLRKMPYTATSYVKIWEWCTSGKGEPTREKITDGMFGRANSTIFIPQPRRRSPGWDGCRDLTWKFPSWRSDHTAAFVKKYMLLLFYGGVGLDKNDIHDAATLTKTHSTNVMDELWALNMNNCVSNCSDQGVCTNGFCKCDPGYYGIDCSNSTCPGSVCYYDRDNEHHCTHCCHDGFMHSSGSDDVYVAGVRKLTCQKKEDGYFTGTSNGICDGFGSCQCAPPFVGEDCSMKDCKYNCSFNGFCSVEYPVSRCMCNDGYFGEHCQYTECLNKCSYPNGVCNYISGDCTCDSIPHPYNNDIIFSYWQGEDCSFLVAWSAGCNMTVSRIISVFLGVITVFLIIISIVER